MSHSQISQKQIDSLRKLFQDGKIVFGSVQRFPTMNFTSGIDMAEEGSDKTVVTFSTGNERISKELTIGEAIDVSEHMREFIKNMQTINEASILTGKNMHEEHLEIEQRIKEALGKELVLTDEQHTAISKQIVTKRFIDNCITLHE